MVWPEFQGYREAFFNDRRLRATIVLSTIKLSEAAVDSQRREMKLVRKALNEIDALQRIVDEMKSSFALDYKSAIKLIDELRSEIERTLFSPGSAPSDGIRRGPKSYPRLLGEWIYEIIDLAKGDRERLLILVDFFKPRGAFDKWLGQLTNGVLQGPSKKKDPILQPRERDVETDLKWLNDFKNSYRPAPAKSAPPL